MNDPRVLALALAIANTPVRCTPKGARPPRQFASLAELPDEAIRARFIEEAETALAVMDALACVAPPASVAQ